MSKAWRTAKILGVLLVLSTVTVLADHIGFGGPTYPVTGAPRAVIAMDLDADGKTDFASADMLSDTVTLYRGDGTGALTLWSVLALPGGAGPFDITAADLNRDGTNDLIVANADNHTVAIFLSKHGGVPGDNGRLTLRVAGSPRGVAVADVNRDGKLDLAVTGAACSCVAVLRNDGAGAFTEMARIGGLGQPHGIAVGDFNRDDIPDLAVAVCERWTDSFVADVIDRAAAHESHCPCFERASVRSVTVSASPDVEKRFLRRILGAVGIATDRSCCRQCSTSMPIEELLECSKIV